MRTATLGLAAGFTAVLGVTLVIQLAHFRTAHKGHNAAGDVWSSTFLGREDTKVRLSQREEDTVTVRIADQLRQLDGDGGGDRMLEDQADKTHLEEHDALQAEVARLKEEISVLRKQATADRGTTPHAIASAPPSEPSSPTSYANRSAANAAALNTTAAPATSVLDDTTAFASEAAGQEAAFDPESVVVTYESCMASLEGKPTTKRWNAVHGNSPLCVHRHPVVIQMMHI
jgi:hypothetical protein